MRAVSHCRDRELGTLVEADLRLERFHGAFSARGLSFHWQVDLLLTVRVILLGMMLDDKRVDDF
jgi:hypothetical protein